MSDSRGHGSDHIAEQRSRMVVSNVVIRPFMVLLLAVVMAACGGNPATDRIVSVEARGVRDDQPLVVADGRVEVDEEVEIYAALVRFGSVRLTGHGDLVELAVPQNVDLIAGTVLFEEPWTNGPLEEVELGIPAPQDGVGVLPGRDVSVFVGGLLGGVPFEYTDISMADLAVDIEQPLQDGMRVSITFDVGEWFSDLDTETLVQTDGTILLDYSNNAEAMAQIEANIAESVDVCVTCAAEDEEVEVESSSESEP